MRLVFMGTPDIARKCLQRLYEDGHEIVGVYTKQDTPKNRGMKMIWSEVKEYAVAHGLPVYQPVRWKADSTYEELKALQPELIVVVAYGRILPQRVLDLAPLGAINLHASLLPLLRGSAPVQWSVLNGFQTTGATVMYLDAEMDTGDMISRVETPIGPDETSGELMDRLGELGAELLSQTVRRMEAGPVEAVPQDHSQATYAPMLSKEMAPIDWSRSPAEIHNHIRGMIPWPVATAVLDGKRFKIYKIEPVEGARTDRTPGTPVAITKQGLQVACGDGQVVTVVELQAEGGKRMRVADYLRGHPMRVE